MKPQMTLGSTHDFVSIAFGAFVECTVSSNFVRASKAMRLDRKYIGKLRTPDIERYRNAFVLKWMNSLPVCIAFSAFALESFINKLGEEWLTKKSFLECLEYMEVKKKWKAVFRFGKGIDLDEAREPFQSIKKLFDARNDIVHDKPTTVTSMEEYRKLAPKRVYKVDQYGAFGTLIKVEKFMNDEVEKTKFHHIVKPFYQKGYKEWIDSPKRFTVDDGLVFEKTKFPSSFQYKFEVRRATGIRIIDVCEDESTMRIKSR